MEICCNLLFRIEKQVGLIFDLKGNYMYMGLGEATLSNLIIRNIYKKINK